MRRFLWLVLLTIVSVSCGGGGDATSTTAVVATTQAASTTTSSAAPSSTTATSTTTSTTEPPGPTIGTELLLAGPDGVFLVNPDGASALLIEGPAVFAIDDLDGGVLFQKQRNVRERGSIVYRVRAEESAAIETLVPSRDQGLALNGIARDGDETYVYYSREEGSNPDDDRKTLRRYSLQTREVTELDLIGGWEASSFPVSISDSLILLNWSGEAYAGMRFTDLRANAAAVAANPAPDEGFFDCSACPSVGELAADGERLVYREVENGVDYAVVKHVASGAEVRRIELGGINLWRVISFDLTDDFLVVNRASDTSPLTPWIYDLSQVDPTPVDVGIEGEAYITRSPVAVSGSISLP